MFAKTLMNSACADGSDPTQAHLYLEDQDQILVAGRSMLHPFITSTSALPLALSLPLGVS